MFFDPSGLIVTEWDLLHCTPDEIEILRKNTEDWNNGSRTDKDRAAASSEKIRSKYRDANDVAHSDGTTTQYYANTELKNLPNKTIFNLSINYGVGLNMNASIFGVKVEVGGKVYYDLTNVASNNPTLTMQWDLNGQITDKVKIGIQTVSVNNPSTKEHISNSTFAGVKIGNDYYGVGAICDEEDFIVDFNAGFYLGVGGDLILEINISELLRRISK